MNFRDRMKKGQEQNGINKTTSTKNLYRDITNHLSQQFQPGDFRKTQHIPIIKKNSRIQQINYQEEILQPQTQNYVERNTVKSRHKPISLLNSNVDNGSFFQSKINQTRGELQDQIFDVEKRLTQELDKNKRYLDDFITWNIKKNIKIIKQEIKSQQTQTLNSIVTQLNTSLITNSKKNKIIQNSTLENQQKIKQIQTQFNQYVIEMEQKMERIMNNNSNPDIASSMKKSFSRNMGDYAVQLKSSMKEIPSLALVDEIRNQIHQTSEAIKSLKFEITQVREQIKSKAYNPTKGQQTTVIESPKLDFIHNEINALKMQIQDLETQKDTKFNEFRSILEVQDQNLQGMNETLKNVINNQILLRLKKIQDLQQPQVFERQAETIKRQVLKQLESVPIIRVRHNPQNREKLEKMKNLPKSQQDTYMLDENNFILDIFGNYLIDENNNKIKLEQQQIYYLQNIEGIQITTLSTH